MANSSQVPAPGIHEVRPNDAANSARGAFRAVMPASAQAQTPAPNAEELPEPQPIPGSGSGQRKLIRPTLPMRALRSRSFSPRSESPIFAHSLATHTSQTAFEASHAEAFYFQKQVQAQTPMVFVLEDGEHIEGCIEWYDRNAIKVKNSVRMLIYKSSIKYLYKAGENHS